MIELEIWCLGLREPYVEEPEKLQPGCELVDAIDGNGGETRPERAMKIDPSVNDCQALGVLEGRLDSPPAEVL